jgi:hypothetical protein
VTGACRGQHQPGHRSRGWAVPRPGETIIGTNSGSIPGEGREPGRGRGARRRPSSLIGWCWERRGGQNCSRDARCGCRLRRVRVVPDAPTGRDHHARRRREYDCGDSRGEQLLSMSRSSDRLPARGHLRGAAGDPIEATLSRFAERGSPVPQRCSTPLRRVKCRPSSSSCPIVLVVNVHEFRATFGVAVDDCLTAESCRMRNPPLQRITARDARCRGVAIWQDGSPVRISGHPVSAVDSTGAGDCFVGYLAAGLGRAFPRAARTRANRAAAIGVTRHGALYLDSICEGGRFRGGDLQGIAGRAEHAFLWWAPLLTSIDTAVHRFPPIQRFPLSDPAMLETPSHVKAPLLLFKIKAGAPLGMRSSVLRDLSVETVVIGGNRWTAVWMPLARWPPRRPEGRERFQSPKRSRLRPSYSPCPIPHETPA